MTLAVMMLLLGESSISLVLFKRLGVGGCSVVSYVSDDGLRYDSYLGL